MIDLDDAGAYADRAEMHEQLAAATSDVQARKMHQAMAAEYRRREGEAREMIETVARSGSDAGMLVMDSHV